jgi:hypothetical protein
LLQVVLSGLLQVDICRLAWCNLFHQLASLSLQMSTCSKPDFSRLDASWWRDQQTCCNLLTTCSRPVNPQLAASLGRFWLCNSLVPRRFDLLRRFVRVWVGAWGQGWLCNAQAFKLLQQVNLKRYTFFGTHV